jgi:osmoprotectant transport system substrate-binding protein
MRNLRSSVLGAALLALSVTAAACGPGGDGGQDGGGEPSRQVTIGAVAFPENQILGEMYAQTLEEAGYTVERQLNLESREVLQPAIQDGQIDIAPEYLSSLLLFFNPDAEASGDPEQVRTELEPLLADTGQVLLESSPAQDQNALVVTQETANQFNLQTTSDLAGPAGELTLGGPPECPQRPFCIPGFNKVYGIEFGNFVPLDVGGPLTTEALTNGDIDVALLFSTDPAIEENGWVLLEDDQQLQAAENITPVVAEDVLDPTIEERLNAISAALDTATMTELNGQVSIDGADPAEVASTFLQEQGLLGN